MTESTKTNSHAAKGNIQPVKIEVDAKRQSVQSQSEVGLQDRNRLKSKKKPMTKVGGWKGLFRGTPDF